MLVFGAPGVNEIIISPGIIYVRRRHLTLRKLPGESTLSATGAILGISDSVP